MKSIGFVVAATAASVLASTASADCWTLTFDGYGLSKNVKYYYNNTNNWDAANVGPNGFAFGATAGQHLFSGLGNSYANYCVQVFQGNPSQPQEWCTAALEDVPDAAPPAPGQMGPMKATLIQDLYARFHYAVQNSNSNTQAAAFQVVVWELTHENFDTTDASVALGRISLDTGAYQLSNDALYADVMAAANSMIAALGTGGFKSLGDNLFGLTSDVWQDHLVVIPIPAPALLAGVGLLGVVALRRRAK